MMIVLNDIQRKKLEKLWFIYGNNGKKHTHCNHRYIQNILEHGEDSELFYTQSIKSDLTQECINEVKAVFSESNFKPPPPEITNSRDSCYSGE